MKVQLTNGTFVSIGWQYTKCTKKLNHSKAVEEVEQECTTCFIRNGEEPLAEVTITRYHKDQDNKPLARKTTFAMAVASFSKADKELLWNTFLANVKLPGSKAKIGSKSKETA